MSIDCDTPGNLVPNAGVLPAPDADRTGSTRRPAQQVALRLPVLPSRAERPVPDIHDREIFLCGPTTLTDAVLDGQHTLAGWLRCI
jgi:hypothetical protein